MNFGFKTQREGWKLLFNLHRVTSVKLNSYRCFVRGRSICVEDIRLVHFTLEKAISISYEYAALLCLIVQIGTVHACEPKSVWH